MKSSPDSSFTRMYSQIFCYMWIFSTISVPIPWTIKTTRKGAVCSDSRGVSKYCPLWGTEGLSLHHCYRQPLKAAVFFCLLSPAIHKRVHVSLSRHLAACQIFFQLVLDILLEPLRILSYYPQRVPGTRNSGSCICTLGLHVYRKSSAHFCSWASPRTVLYT